MKERRQQLSALLDTTRNEYILRRRHTETRQYSLVDGFGSEGATVEFGIDVDLEKTGHSDASTAYRGGTGAGAGGYAPASVADSTEVELNLDSMHIKADKNSYSPKKKSGLRQNLLNKDESEIDQFL